MTGYRDVKGGQGSMLALLLLLNYWTTNPAGAETRAAITTPAGNGKLNSRVLSPEKFKLPVKLGYQAAQKAPAIMKQIFCYCGCDRTDSHTCLLDCFTSVHGAYCAICQEEAIEASGCHAKGMPIAKIQNQIERHYAKRYPFASPSAKLSKYRAHCCR